MSATHMPCEDHRSPMQTSKAMHAAVNNNDALWRSLVLQQFGPAALDADVDQMPTLQSLAPCRPVPQPKRQSRFRALFVYLTQAQQLLEQNVAALHSRSYVMPNCIKETRAQLRALLSCIVQLVAQPALRQVHERIFDDAAVRALCLLVGSQSALIQEVVSGVLASIIHRSEHRSAAAVKPIKQLVELHTRCGTVLFPRLQSQFQGVLLHTTRALIHLWGCARTPCIEMLPRCSGSEVAAAVASSSRRWCLVNYGSQGDAYECALFCFVFGVRAHFWRAAAVGVPRQLWQPGGRVRVRPSLLCFGVCSCFRTVCPRCLTSTPTLSLAVRPAHSASVAVRLCYCQTLLLSDFVTVRLWYWQHCGPRARCLTSTEGI